MHGGFGRHQYSNKKYLPASSVPAGKYNKKKSLLLILLLMTILPQTFFAFVGSNLMTFSLFTARHTSII
jgi:hypothetical protein